MNNVVHRQAFVPLPLLRAIAALPAHVESNGRTIELTGRVGASPIVAGFTAHRAYVHGPGSSGWIDLSAASSWRCEMTLRLEGLDRDDVDGLLLALRAAMVGSPQRREEPAVGGRMVVCRTA